jgi:hypothetical protein
MIPMRGTNYTDRVRHGLFIDKEDEEEEEDKGETKKMDDAEEEEEERGQVVSSSSSPWETKPQPSIEHIMEERFFRFNHLRLHNDMHSIPPNVMNAFESGFKEAGQKITEMLCVHNILPRVVHGSPVIACLMHIFVTPKGTFIPRDDKIRPVRQTYTSSLQSLYQLQCVKMGVERGDLIKFAPSFKRDDLDVCNGQYMVYLSEMTNRLDTNLDALYTAAPSVTQETTLNNLFAILNQHTYEYIHLLEWYLWKTCFEPHGLHQEELMTPFTDSVTIERVEKRVRDNVVDDTVMFFRHKQDRCEAQVIFFFYFIFFFI